MTDIVLEVVRAIIVAVIFYSLLSSSRAQTIREQKGWLYIVYGFGLIFVGMIFDITDNFESLNKYIIIGDTVFQAYIEKVFGYMIGFLLLAIGFRQWLPVVITLRKTEIKFNKTNDLLELKVNELMHSNIKLENEIEERNKYAKQMTLASSVFENTIEGIVITDNQGKIQRVNEAFTTITGFKSDEAVGQNSRILKSNRHDRKFYEEMWQSLTDKGTWKGEIWNRRKNSETYPEMLSINAIKDPEGETVNYVGLFHDISDIKRAEEKLHYQAHFDALTGLPNRELFNERLRMAIAYARRNELPLGILFIDLDDFKNVNDSLGHYYGDLLLQQAAERLELCCREEDTIARVSGDEFLILAHYIRNEERAATRIAERITNAFKKPFMLKDKQMHVGTSIGIAIYPSNGETIETMIKNADVALYRSKGKGKNQFTLFTEAMNQEVLRKISLGNDLREALKRNEFKVYYQPKVNIRSGLISGMEALLRWNRWEKEMVLPNEFIPLAEDLGIINSLGEWVLSTACRQAREFGALFNRDLSVSVNLSVKQFRQENLISMIEVILHQTGLSPGLLTLEITESIVIEDIKETIEILTRLKKLGIHVSIDDFGTGYSSLAYLKRMPLSELKIDKSFIDNVPNDAEASEIVKTILSLASNLKLNTVAEGVETKEQLALLYDQGCKEMQGFWFSKPLPASEMRSLIKEGKELQIN